MQSIPNIQVKVLVHSFGHASIHKILEVSEVLRIVQLRIWQHLCNKKDSHIWNQNNV